MLPKNKYTQRIVICAMLIIGAQIGAQAQSTQPNWWFGLSGAANLNFYSGTTQRLNNSLIVPTAFHKGFGASPYGSFLVEYRPAGMWGVALNVAYDNRSAKFDDVVAPCNCPATLETTTSYIAVEPTLRMTVPSTHFYLFAGPRVAFNIQNSFEYTQLKQPNTDADLSSVNKTVFSGQVGAGYDFPISSPKSTTKVSLSPFVSYHPYFGQDPRSIESWSVQTVRVGIALKFGKGAKDAPKPVEKIAAVAVIPVREVAFSVTLPKATSTIHQVSETLPLLNVVFFDEGLTSVPNRYVLLNADQATSFNEAQLQKEQSSGMSGRSARQLFVYHNILNILGDRMRTNPGTTITLVGSSAKGPQDGKAFAASVKQYLVSVFAIDGNRIAVQGRIKPMIPSQQPGGVKDIALLRAEDSRVDILSKSPALLSEVGGDMKPVQFTATKADPMDSQVVFNNDGASDLLQTWSITTTDETGNIKNYGPFTGEKAGIESATILGDRTQGDYKVTMNGTTKAGMPVKKESSVHLVRPSDVIEKGQRYSVTFNFDQSQTIASYQKFLKETVAPLITDGATVTIHGHTDVIGEGDHNQKLSDSRAQQTQKIIEAALANSGRNNVKFETVGFGADAGHAPFENSLPEERFYNRTVIIDIAPVK